MLNIMLHCDPVKKKIKRKLPKKNDKPPTKVSDAKIMPVSVVEKKSLQKPDLFVGSNRYQVLSFEQVQQLQTVLDKTLLIKPNDDSGLPTIKITLRDLLGKIRNKLIESHIVVNDIRLNMDVASSVMSSKVNVDFRVVDVICNVTLDDPETQHHIKNAVFKVLVSILRKCCVKGVTTVEVMDVNEELIKNHYIRSMARVNNAHDPLGDVWSLISFGIQDSDGQTVEMKFIDRLKRQYEFTVDSFQIILDTLLSFHKISKGSLMTAILFPTVVVECVSGSIQEALRHLKDRKVFTRHPEEIVGGGLLRFCQLITDGFKVDTAMDGDLLEKYMCSRFFIDFPDLYSQRRKIEICLNIFFYDNFEKQSAYMKLLYKVVAKSTVCLMIHERRQSLQLIKDILKKCLLSIELKKSAICLDDVQSGMWNLDQIFFGTQYFPQQVYVVDSQKTDDYDGLGLSNNDEDLIPVFYAKIDSIQENQDILAT